MTRSRNGRIVLALLVVIAVLAGLVFALRAFTGIGKNSFSAVVATSKGIFKGDEIRILGVKVGEITSIEAGPDKAKINFWVENKYKVPADAKAVMVNSSLVSSRALELTPVYTGGPAMAPNTVIPMDRTAVPVEFDDLKSQLNKLNETLQPSRPGGLSTAGEFTKAVADNMRGQGANIREAVEKLSQTVSILGDQSPDLFGTIKNLSVLLTGLRDSSSLLTQLNDNFAAVSATLANDPGEVGRAMADLNGAVTEVATFVRDNRETVGITTDKLAEISVALNESSDEVKQALHAFPVLISNFVNIHQPVAGGYTGALAGAQFGNPIMFLCGAIQAASKLNAEQSAKLCVQYLAPILKNRQYNFLGPIGENFFVGVMARPNEITYSEDWLRPDYVPPAGGAPGSPPAAGGPGLPAEATGADPSAGLAGLMVPQGGGS